MEKASAFGRAGSVPPIPPRRHLEDAAGAPPAAQDTLDEELRAWKAARPRPVFAWRPFLLMAGLCFGAGSLVLPDTVNEAATWALYVLAAVSFFAGLRRPRGKL